MAQKPKQPKVRKNPTTKLKIRAKAALSDALDRQDYETITWRFSIVDLDGPWGWKTKAGKDWWSKIFPKLKDFESMTWDEITQASGGKSHGNNSHPVPVARLSQEAKARLKKINQEDLSDLFSLRLDAKTRIFGIRDRRALKLLWYDPDHSVCPMANK